MFLKYLDHSRFHVPVLVALCLLLFFPFLGARDFWDIETQFAEVIRVMALDGAYLLPTMNGELWSESPPLYFWLAVLFARLAGQVNEWSIRLPSALSAMELVMVSYFFARRKFGDRLAFFSSVVLATAVLTVHVERHVPINMTFYLFLTLALFLSMEVLVFNSVRLGHAYGAWSFAALACLTNGAAGIVFPALIIIPYLIISRRWRQARALRPFTGATLFFAVLALWAAAVSWKSTDAWPRIIFAQLSIVHHSSHASADHQSFFRFPLAFTPWTFLIVPAIISLWPNRSNLRDHAILFMFLWFLSALAFSEFLPGYHSHYVFLTFLPMALGFGVFLDRLVDAGDGVSAWPWTHRFVALASAIFLLMGIVAPFIVATHWPFVSTPAVALASAVIFFSVVIFCASRRRNVRALIFGLAVFTVVTNGLLQALLFPALNELNGRPFAERIGELVTHQAGAGVAIVKDTRVKYFNYYSGIKRFETLDGPKEIEKFLGAAAPRYLLVREKNLKMAQDGWRGELNLVLSETTTRGRWLLLSPCVRDCNPPRSSAGP